MSDRGDLAHFMSLCGRYDFVDPCITYRVTPYYFKEDELLPDELHLFERTVLGHYVDASTVKVGQRCRVRPQIHLAKHLFATLEADEFSDSLQGRFHLWLEYKPDVVYEAALESFLKFIDDNISKLTPFRSTEVMTDLDQAIQYHSFIYNNTKYVAIQPRIESTYLPPYQKPEFYRVESLPGFERTDVQFYFTKGHQTYWYENVRDFYKGGGHGFPTRSIWGEDGPVFQAFTDTGWSEVYPYEIHLAKSG